MSKSAKTDIEIKKLEFPYSIITRPGMYVGSTETPDTIIRELIDNSLDEAMNGYADKVVVNIDNKDYWSSSLDNGRGIPVYLDDAKDDDSEIAIDIFTKIHVGGKFDSGEYTIGTFGVGATATNALSDNFLIILNLDNNKNTKKKPKWIEKDYVPGANNIYVLHFSKGILVKKYITNYDECKTYLANIGCSKIYPDDMSEWSTLAITNPTENIFTSRKSKYNVRELELQKMIYPNIDITYNGTSIEPFEVTTQSFKQTKFFDDKIFRFDIEYENKYDYHGTEKTSKNKFVIVYGYSNDDFSQGFDASVNTLDTTEGYHVQLCSKMIQRSFKDKFVDMDARDALYGLRMFVLCMTNAPEYTSQSKEKLGRIYGVSIDDIYPIFKKSINKIYDDNKEYFESLCTKIIEYKATIGVLSQKNFIKSKVIYGDDRRAKGGLGVKMWDCSSRNRSQCELFVCEGKSASGSIVNTRDPKIHAVLPLRGKVKNTSNIDLETALNNKEILSLINSIGVGCHPYVDLSKARYGRVIVATDADIDGAHIINLILAAFANFLPELVEAGMLYIAVAPLYETKENGGYKYYWDDNMDELKGKRTFYRMKGLGSMEKHTTRDTLLDPNTRRLYQVTGKDLDKALELLQSSSVRRDLMIDNGVIDLKDMVLASDDDVNAVLSYNPDSITSDVSDFISDEITTNDLSQ